MVPIMATSLDKEPDKRLRNQNIAERLRGCGCRSYHLQSHAECLLQSAWQYFALVAHLVGGFSDVQIYSNTLKAKSTQILLFKN
jgi:hypothetical protein